jgi:hypothetical protein
LIPIDMFMSFIHAFTYEEQIPNGYAMASH